LTCAGHSMQHSVSENTAVVQYLVCIGSRYSLMPKHLCGLPSIFGEKP
jgi:hypothetical protein